MTTHGFRANGLTLVELMVTVAIMAIFLAIGVPGLRQFMVKDSQASVANDLLTILNYARGEAIKQSTPMTLCPSSDGTSCTGGWSSGWIMFADKNSNGTVDSAGNEKILRLHDAPIGGASVGSALKDNGGTAVTRITYSRNGTANHTGQLAVCADGDVTKAKILSITLSRTRIMTTAEFPISSCANPVAP